MQDLEATDDEAGPSTQDSLKSAVRQPGTLAKIVKYFFIFWGVCVVTGGATAVGMANAGMNLTNAAYTGIAIGLLPFIAVALVALLIELFG